MWARINKKIFFFFFGRFFHNTLLRDSFASHSLVHYKLNTSILYVSYSCRIDIKNKGGEKKNGKDRNNMQTWRGEWTEQLTGSSTRMNEYCCLTSTGAGRPVRDGDEWGKRERRVKTRDRRQPGRPIKAAVDRRQNNKMLRQCPPGIAQLTTVPRNCCPNCYAEHLHTTINWYI